MDVAHKIKVLIVDDHPLVRRGLIILLENFDDFEMVGDTADGRTVLTLCAALQPDVVLMDLLMPLMDGITATRLIHDKYPHIRIVILTSSVDETLILDAIKAGATSYLLKTCSVDEVADTLRDAYRGIPTLTPAAIDVLTSTLNRVPKIGSDLTKRECEILSYMVEGLGNAAIARQLIISVSTVKNHITNIGAKLGTGSRTKVTALAVKHHLFARS